MPTASSDFPHAAIRRRATLSLIWSVPIIAAIVAGILVFQNLQKFGPVIHLRFESANGLDANQTVIRYRGVRVGAVRSIQLTPDLRHVQVTVRLQRFAASLAREGSVFWIVRPEVGVTGVHALETIVSGPYIEALPANRNGRAQTQFIGAEESPVIKEGGGTEFILQAALIRSLGASSPVYYRGLQVGKVQYLELSRDAVSVKVHVFIKDNFAPLVRSNTVWWNAGGVDLSWHLRSGLNMTAENLRAVVSGGVSFSTPNTPEGPAPAGTSFELHEKPEEKWLEWAPVINLTKVEVAAPANPELDLDNVNQTPKQP